MSAQLENGYTKIANETLEELSKTLLSSYEWQVLMCVFRKTYGFNKKSDRLPISQIVDMTEMHQSHVSRTIKKLKDRKIVTRLGKFIAFNTNLAEWLPKQVYIKNIPKQVYAYTQTGIKNIPKQADSKETTKETIQKKGLPTQKDFENIDIKKIQEDYQVPESFVVSKWDDLMNYCHAHNKKYSDFNRVLRKFVKEDAVKIRKEHNDKSKIVFIEE